jgi:hypothetical protein
VIGVKWAKKHVKTVEVKWNGRRFPRRQRQNAWKKRKLDLKGYGNSEDVWIQTEKPQNSI